MSDLDQAAIDFQNVLRRVAEHHTERTMWRAHLGPVNFDPITFTVDGCRIERWLFKFAFSAAPVFRARIGDWRPSTDHAALALGTRPIPGTLGLYTVAQQGAKITNEPHINFSFGWRADREAPIGFQAAIRGGYRFACVWEEARSANDQLLFDGAAKHRGKLVWHPNVFDFPVDRRDAGLAVHFDWSGGWTPERFPNVAELRSRYPAPPRERPT